MWKTAVVSAALTAVLTVSIGAGVIRATSAGGSSQPTTTEAAPGAGTASTMDNPFEPMSLEATFDADRPAEANPQAVETPAPPPDATEPEDGWADPHPGTDSEDMWHHMEEMHGSEHMDAMHEHMDAVHGEGSFESMLDYMGDSMMGGGITSGGFGGMMGGGITSGGFGGMMGGGITGGGFGGMTGGGMMGW